MLERLQRAFVLACLAAAAAPPQETPAFRANVELVAVPCAVVDRLGTRVTGLSRGDFRVTDNGTPRVIEQFWLDSNSPLTIGVLVDASESQDDQFAEHRETARTLLEKLLRRGDRAFVLQVAEDIRLWPDLTRSSPGAPFGQPCPTQPPGGPGLRMVSACGPSPLWNAL